MPIEPSAVVDQAFGVLLAHDMTGFTERTVHRTLDPEVVIVELAVDGVVVRSGRPAFGVSEPRR